MSQAEVRDVLEEAGHCYKDACRATTFMQWTFYVMWWAIPVLSTLVAGSAALMGAQEATKNAPWWIVLMSLLVAALTILNKAVAPEEKFEKHGWFRNRLWLFILEYRDESKRISDANPDAAVKAQKIFEFNATKRVELARLKNEWLFYPKPPPSGNSSTPGGPGQTGGTGS